MRFYRSMRSVPEQDAPAQGELSVTVTTALGALPLLDALVTVSRKSVLLHHFITNQDGLAPTVTVSTPPLELSTRPGNEMPYTELNVRVFLQGYYAVYRTGIEVYPNQTSYLQVDLVPLPADEKTSEIEIITDTPPHQLYSETGGSISG